MPNPALVVLAGVNGAGKSSVGGHLLAQSKVTWFNPDTFARELAKRTNCSQDEANAQAWREGLRRLDDAIAGKYDHAFETTLGGSTVPARILAASRTHDVLMWFYGLASAELHIKRVQARVNAGGHDIPEATIRARYVSSVANLIALLPHLAQLRLFDNSAEAPAGASVPDPILVLDMRARKIVWPRPANVERLAATPDWAKPIVEAALGHTT